MNALLLAFEIQWHPGLRGILTVLVGVSVLMGSVYLLLSTNIGARVGFLVALAGLSGWMMLMGIVWAIYGIGYLGPAPHWEVAEVVTTESPTDLAAARLSDAHDLSAWEAEAEDDPHRGEQQAAASAALIDPDGPLGETYESESEFITVGAYAKGGKTKSVFNDWVPGPHPPHYAIIQVQDTKEVEVPFGQAPPPAEADPDAAVRSVIMVRDLGAKRLPSVTLVISMGILFGISCNARHRRYKQLMAARACAGAT